ncbi:B12-binding domain-containing radical SAM protein [Jatrophihabitans lederbergiae]|uniref:B12-binding domain-containing radical SAM protein n=1 Tax=Jatrophihabitans lederbergiae TaxID=3075547 RepID=A0ABU2JC46_9ACTN|nr:B12-binding domain-containing radical SAM protein [Jatrophihabitans sp. DSM 44399]MDT0262303.1 B12-binding domain-containing radical SAM protein [Jatrophihabitans sp. DSM 44399]
MTDDVVTRIRSERRARIDGLLRHERDWCVYPGDGGSPLDVSEAALQREQDLWRTAEQLRERLGDGAPSREVLKYFPVLFVSAPHIERGVTGTFPGMPTPLLYATSLADRLVLIDEFPAQRTPRTVAVLNPGVYDDDFVAELRRVLRVHRPVLVGVSNLSEGHHYALRVAAIVKEEVPSAVVLFGGQHEDGVNPLVYRSASERVSRMPERQRAIYADFELSDAARDRLADLETLAAPSERAVVDLVFAGDAPYAMVEILQAVADSPDGDLASVKADLLRRRANFAALPGSGVLSFWDDSTGQVCRLPLSGSTVDANQLPFFDTRGLARPNRFPVFEGQLTAQIMACLGCKYSCSFCHESADAFLYASSKFRQRTARHVIAEMQLRYEQGYRALFFDDSTFTQNPAWLAQFLPLVTAELPGRVEWGCQTTINDLDEAMVGRMADSGCTYIYFGLESAEPTPDAVQKVLQLRRTNARLSWSERLREVAGWCRAAGVRIGTSLQFGLGESSAERMTTLRLVAELHREGLMPDGCVALNVNSPYPGTRQWLGLLGKRDPLPDYRHRLLRHGGFETAHQFSSLTGAAVDEIYRLAVETLGKALHADQVAEW